MYAPHLLVADPVSQLLTLGGVELSNSRRYVDLLDVQAIRWQYVSGGSIDVRIDYSLDDGATWTPLADEYETTGTAPRLTAWQVIPEVAQRCDVLIRAVGVGTGLLTSVTYVEAQYR